MSQTTAGKTTAGNTPKKTRATARRRPMWLRHKLLAPYAAEPLGLALAAMLTLVTALTPQFSILGSVVATAVLLRLVIRSGQRTAIAVGLATRQILERSATVLSLVTLATATWLHVVSSDVLAIWLIDLAGWTDPRLWLVQVVLPAVVLLPMFGLPGRRAKRQASPFLQAYLFGHRPRAYAMTYLWRVSRVALLVLFAWFSGASEGADAAITTADRMHALSVAVADAGDVGSPMPVGGASNSRNTAGQIKPNEAGKAAWAGWQEASLTGRAAVADRLPMLLLQQAESTRVALIDAWLAPAVGRGSRGQFLTRLFRLDANLTNTAKTPAAAVWRGLRARCSAAAFHGDCLAPPPARPRPLWRMGLDQQPAVAAQMRSSLARAQAWHDLLGGWARHNGLCPTSLDHAGWGGQARVLFLTTLCQGKAAPQHHAAIVAQAVAAAPGDSFRWRIPGRANTTLALTARPTKRKGGPAILMHRPAGALRDVTDLADLVVPGHGRSEPTRAENAEDRAGKSPRWRRESLHLWTVDAAMQPLWAGVVVLDRETFLRGRCGFTGRGCNGGARLGVQVRKTDSPTAPGLRVWRISHHVPSCNDAQHGGVHCARAEMEGLQLRAIQVRSRHENGQIIQATLSASALLADTVEGQRRHRAAMNRAREAVRDGRIRWLADLLGPPPSPVPNAVEPEVTLLLDNDARLTLRRVDLRGDDVVPVVRLILDQQVLALAATHAAHPSNQAANQAGTDAQTEPGTKADTGTQTDTGTKAGAGTNADNAAVAAASEQGSLPRCQAEAKALHLVHAAGDHQRWHAVTLDTADQWYKRFTGKRPTRPLCVLAPILPYLQRNLAP